MTYTGYPQIETDPISITNFLYLLFMVIASCW